MVECVCSIILQKRRRWRRKMRCKVGQELVINTPCRAGLAHAAIPFHLLTTAVYGLADIARHIMRCRSFQYTRVQSLLDDVTCSHLPGPARAGHLVELAHAAPCGRVIANKHPTQNGACLTIGCTLKQAP